MYDEGDNVVTMNIKNNPEMINEHGRYMSIDKLNGSPGLRHWGYVAQKGNQTRPE